VGRLNTEVTGSAPTFAVFDKGTVRTYNAYNPDATSKTVTFNDGFSMVVPARTQIHRTGTVKPVSVAYDVSHALPPLVSSKTIIAFGGKIALRGLGKTTRSVELYSPSGRKMWASGVVAGKFSATPCVSKGLYIVKQYR
jgi:hypothetical protein